MVRGAAVVAVNGVSVKAATHTAVVQLVRESGNTLELVVQGAVELPDVVRDADLADAELSPPQSPRPGHAPVTPAMLAAGLMMRRPHAATAIADDQPLADDAFSNPLYRRET